MMNNIIQQESQFYQDVYMQILALATFYYFIVTLFESIDYFVQYLCYRNTHTLERRELSTVPSPPSEKLSL